MLCIQETLPRNVIVPSAATAKENACAGKSGAQRDRTNQTIFSVFAEADKKRFLKRLLYGILRETQRGGVQIERLYR